MYIEGFLVNSICCLGFALKHTWPENKVVNTYRHNTFKNYVCRGEGKKKQNTRVGTVQVKMGTLRFVLWLYFCRCSKVLVKKKKKKERAREKEKENLHLQVSPGTPECFQMKLFFKHEECSYPASHGPGPPAPQWVWTYFNICKLCSLYKRFFFLLWHFENKIILLILLWEGFFYVNLQVMVGGLLTFYKILIVFD